MPNFDDDDDNFQQNDAPQQEASYIYGRHAVMMMLKQSPKRVTKLWVADNAQPDKRLQAIMSMAHEARLPIMKVPKVKLASLVANALAEEQADAEEPENNSQYGTSRRRDQGRDSFRGAPPPSRMDNNRRGQFDNRQGGRPDNRGFQQRDEAMEAVHQGVVASVAAQPVLSLQELLDRLPKPLPKAGLLLMLDGVTDPRNLGAMLRVADACGAWGVILGKHRSGQLGPAVAKTACGADLSVPVAVVTNLSQTMETLKKLGFWTVASVCEDGSALAYYKQDYVMPTLLLLGSEGEGLSAQLVKNSDFKITIPMMGLVNSLNVAAAAAVLCFEIAKAQLLPSSAKR
jgi:23S rRNA (guanosine2251-2'-O)-methyltransferase